MRHFLFYDMSAFLIIAIATFLALMLLMLGLGVKILLKKNGEFKRHCASRDPYTGKSSGCFCAQKDECNRKPQYSPLDVNKQLIDEL